MSHSLPIRANSPITRPEALWLANLSSSQRSRYDAELAAEAEQQRTRREVELRHFREDRADAHARHAAAAFLLLAMTALIVGVAGGTEAGRSTAFVLAIVALVLGALRDASRAHPRH